MGQRPLRIALATIEYPPDPFSAGIGSYTKTLACGLAERGHTVHVVTRGSGTDSVEAENGVVVHRITPGRPVLPDRLRGRSFTRLVTANMMSEWRYRAKLARRIEQLAATGKVDLVEAADHMAEPWLYRPRRHPEVPFVVRLHTPMAFSERVDANIPEFARLAVRWAERGLLLRATHLSAPSAVSAELFRREMSLGTRQIAVFPNPPSYPLDVSVSPDHIDPNLVLFVGRITRWKGAHVLVRAIPAIKDAWPQARFAFVGADHIATREHASVADYLRSILPSRYQGAVTFTGHLTHGDVAGYYRRAAVCVFPSLFDNFPYACLEAMSHGKAIVGSNSGGMAEMLAGSAGLLYTPPDHVELAKHVSTLLADPERRELLGAAARRKVEKDYRKEAVLDTVEAFYRRALAERRDVALFMSRKSGPAVN